MTYKTGTLRYSAEEVAQMPYRPPTDPDLSCLYKDDDILVFDKASGLLTVPGRQAHMQDCLASRALAKYGPATIVHRLDMDTSGVIILARHKEAHRNLSRSFELRETSKTYLAWVSGSVEEEDGCIDLPLICDWPNRPLQKVCFDTGKKAVTKWRVLERQSNKTLVELTPITGRSHQLRVHMLQLGHPILGDDMYADEAAYQASNRLCLHAYCLKIAHPMTKEPCEFIAPSPF